MKKRMTKKIPARILVFAVSVVLIVQAGLVAYSMIVSADTTGQQAQTAVQTQTIETQTPQQEQFASSSPSPSTDISSITISDEILGLIQQSDPANYDKNVTNYKDLLVKCDVPDKFKNEIERLITAGYRLPDILTAYAFLYDDYGLMGDIQKLADLKQSGETWAQIFTGYDKANPAFVPQSFDPDYLEKLMKTPGITSDDIMIADRVSQKVTKPFSEIIGKREQGEAWRDINAEYDVLNTQSAFPHVPVTEDQIKKYTGSSSLTEQQVVEAFVIALKLGESGEDVINSMKSGESSEEIYADCYQAKYY